MGVLQGKLAVEGGLKIVGMFLHKVGSMAA